MSNSGQLHNRVRRLEAAQAPGTPSYDQWFPAHEREEARFMRQIFTLLLPELAGQGDIPMFEDGKADQWLVGDTEEQAASDRALVARGCRWKHPLDD